MRTVIKLSVSMAMIGLLAGCKPGPITLGGEPVPVTNSQGQVHYVNYKIHQTRVATVSKTATGSDLITYKIRSEFAKDPALSPYNIDVQTHRGEVTLTGQVPSAAIKNYAIKMARYNKGVLMVRDNLAIKP